MACWLTLNGSYVSLFRMYLACWVAVKLYLVRVDTKNQNFSMRIQEQ